MRQIIPSFANGFYSPWRATGEALYPNLWRGCIGAWNPAIGVQGSTLYDWSGFRRHGTLTNMSVSDDWTTAAPGIVLDFDGSNDHINCGDVCDLTGNMSIFARAYFRTNGTQSIVARQKGNTESNYWFHHLNSVLKFNFHDGTGYRSITGPTAGLTTWRNIIVAFESGVGATFYVDGVATFASTTYSLSSKTSARLYFAGDYYTVTDPFKPMDGQLQMVGIWSRLLTAGEAAILSADPHAPYRIKRRRRAVIAAAAPAGVAPTSHLYGSLVGPLGGPV